MIILQELDKYNLPVVSFPAIFGLVIHVNDPRQICQRSRIPSALTPICFDKEADGQSVRMFDYGDKSSMERQALPHISGRQLAYLHNYFFNISDLNKKLCFSYLSSFPYHATGHLLYYFKQSMGSSSESLYLIHTSWKSYLSANCGIPVDFHIVHFYLPVSDIISSVKAIFSVAKKLCSSALCRLSSLWQNHSVMRPSQQPPQGSCRHTAIIFHLSTSYGHLFEKNHFYSPIHSSPLHISNVSRYVNAACSLESLDKGLRPLQSLFSLHHYATSFVLTLFFLLGNISSIRSFSSFAFLVYLTGFYFRYIAYVSVFSLLSYRNVIIDYDVLFSKPLSLALESLGIRSISLQERPSLSFCDYVYSTICDTYLYAGKIYMSASIERGSSVIAKRVINMGPWRLSFFYDKSLVPLSSLSIRSASSVCLSEKTGYIAVLGYFPVLAPGPLFSVGALSEFERHVRSLAHAFPHVPVVLRYKSLQGLSSDTALLPYRSFPNVFLCDDYCNMNASYSLCKEASAIVSVQTSLAEECLAFGKRVVLIDDYHSVKGFCSEIYPDDFAFMIAQDRHQLVSMVQRILSADPNLETLYEELSAKLSGETDLSIPGAVALALEKCLC